MAMPSEAPNFSVSFESQVRDAFHFLETEHGMAFSGIKEIKGDPRDSGSVARYRTDDFKVDIGWNNAELSLAVLIQFSRNDLPRQQRHVYLDSFTEFISGQKEQSTVPQIYPRMSEAGIAEAMERRQQLFHDQAFSAILFKLAEKLRRHLDGILNAPVDVIHGYHQWMASGGKTARTAV
jgi:hypothetical protein